MRLFIALNFEDDVILKISGLQERLRENGVEGNFTRSENLHLTLAFIGEYGDPDDILELMEEISFSPLTLQAEGLQHYRDMYLLRIAENPGMDGYVKRLRRMLAGKGIPFDRKKFSPHITLIRKVSFRNLDLPIPEVLTDEDMVIKRVSLMHSDRGKRGMIYTELGSVEGKGL